MSALAEGIPMVEMDGLDRPIFEQLIEAVRGVASSGAFVGGAAVDRFEDEYARWCEAPFAVGVASGTEALVLALRALDVGVGDEVVVPANSFIATAEAVSLVGAVPRFADVDPVTQLLTVATLEPALTPRVRCVIPVHLYGRTVELAPIMELAARLRLSVIEDSSQAHGARYRGERVGTIGDAGTFSFYPAKNLGAWGDAGVVVTRDGALAERVRLLRSHGEGPRYHHSLIGTTGRLDAIQAAVLSVKLPRLDRANEARRAIARRLNAAVAEHPDVIGPAPLDAGCDHVYHQFVVRSRDRDALRAHLAADGIATGVHYPIPIHRSQAYERLGQASAAPTADALAREILSVPVFPTLGPERVARIGQSIASWSAPAD